MTSQYMREALDLARKGRSLASPNPLVGAILVREGEVVGRGFHTYAGLHHAEIIALAQAGEKARGATLRMVILDGIGNPVILTSPDEELLTQAYEAVAR